MAKVRSDAHLDTRLTDQRLHAALKKVAGIQDRQVEEDIMTSVPKVAPSLRRQERKASSVPEDNDTPNEASPVENAAESQRVYLMDEEMSEEEVAPVPLVRPPEPDYDDWFNFKSDPAYGLGETPKKKKKKGDGLRDVVATLRKNPPQAGVNEKLKINLVTKIPPIPAPKGKKPRSLCVPIYIISEYFTDQFSSPRLKKMVLCLSETTLFFHQLRTANGTSSARAAYLNNKTPSGMVGNWIDIVAEANRSTPSLSHGSSTPVGLGGNALASGSRAARPSTGRLGRLREDPVPDIGDDIDAPEHEASTAKAPVIFFNSLLVLTDLDIVTTPTGFPETQIQQRLDIIPRPHLKQEAPQKGRSAS